MNRLLAPFRKLAWKLTFSYTLVTVGALLVVELVALIAGLAFVLQGNLVPQALTPLIADRVAPQLRPYLEGPTPDQLGLDQWLQDVETNGIHVTGEDGASTRLDLSGDEIGQLLVVDAQGRLLGAVPRGLGGPVGSALDMSVVPGLDKVLPGALAGEQDTGRLYTGTPDGPFAIAAPVRASDGRVLGALVFAGTLPVNAGLFPQALSLLGSSALCFTVAAGLIGTLFGFITARGFSRRLRRVATGASAWGRGDFAARVDDRSGDEIGQLARQLNDVASDLEELMETRQELATLEERNRLARDLHDSVKQQMFAITMNLGSAQALWESKPEEARRYLDTAAGLARQAQGELGALIQTLRPTQLQGKGLAQGLRDLVQAWEKQSGIAAIYQAQGAAELPVEVEQALFRVAQEALANIVRHSGATAVNLTLTLESRQVTLDVRDNGRGFDPVGAHKGLGLRSMQERVQALGGTFAVESGRQGTHLTACVPLEETQMHADEHR